MPNRLLHETSPYLRQHADNPVDWFPWGDEALQKARADDKPIFLSIGYSACHWCHVMAHESFEDERVAAILNDHFVSIKVDREERPDLDALYMSAVQAMTGRGGWPMSVFLTPQGEPFYGGTYFPPERRAGMPSFGDVLRAVADGWRTRREELIESGQNLVAVIQHHNGPYATEDRGALSRDTLHAAARALWRSFDQRHGGWGGAPKFPQPMVLEFLLRYHHSTGDGQVLAMATQTLDAMARGGMYDQLGGGFHRYSTDERWGVPHFEKMLFDNALLARVYLHAWQATRNMLFRTIAVETLDYVIREMTDAAGGFCSTQDADSEGHEGKFFVWTHDEIRDVLDEETDAFMVAYGVGPGGNWEGKSILELAGSLEQRQALGGARAKLFARREERVRPARDEKILTSWNGLMLAAFAEAARALEQDDDSRAVATRYRLVAERNAAFLLRELRTANGRLAHTWKPDRSRALQAGQTGQHGFLEDYAYLIEGLLELYQTTFEPRWFIAARELAETMIDHFAAPSALARPEPPPSADPAPAGAIAGFYDTSDDHEALIARPRDLQDNATPSGNAMAVTALLKLAGLTGEQRYVDIAHVALSPMQPMLAKYPLGFGQWLQALSYLLAPPSEIAVVGEPGAPDTQALLRVVRSGYRPYQVVALGTPAAQPPAVSLLQDRGLLTGRATAYVCRGSACQAPTTEPELLQAQLEYQ